jgi:hypothetical protein
MFAIMDYLILSAAIEGVSRKMEQSTSVVGESVTIAIVTGLTSGMLWYLRH